MEALWGKNTEDFMENPVTYIWIMNMKVSLHRYFNLQCLVIGHKQTALKVSQVQGGVSESLKSSLKFKRHLAFRRVKSDALSEGDELN